MNCENSTFLNCYLLQFYSIMENGEENCQHLIEAHKECMRNMGFNI